MSRKWSPVFGQRMVGSDNIEAAQVISVKDLHDRFIASPQQLG